MDNTTANCSKVVLVHLDGYRLLALLHTLVDGRNTMSLQIIVDFVAKKINEAQCAVHGHQYDYHRKCKITGMNTKATCKHCGRKVELDTTTGDVYVNGSLHERGTT